MAGLAIAVALIVVAVLSVPVPLWASRVSASFRRRRPRRQAHEIGGAGHLSKRLRELLRLGRSISEDVGALVPVAEDYRRTLPYLNLFFADVRSCLDVRSARWVVLARQDYELAVSDLARRLLAWRQALERLNEPEQMAVEAIGGAPGSVGELLDDGTRLPRTPIEAQRLRFCEAWEVERLERSLQEIADDLGNFEESLKAVHIAPYR